jgi:hypothetical protein
MPQEKFIEIPKKVLIRGKKFVDQSVNSHVPVTGVLRHLIAAQTAYPPHVIHDQRGARLSRTDHRAGLGSMGSPGTFLFSTATLPHSTSSPLYRSNCSVGYTMRNRRKLQQTQENPPRATRSGALLLLHPPPRSQQPSNWAMPKQQGSPIPPDPSQQQQHPQQQRPPPPPPPQANDFRARFHRSLA